MRVDGLGRTGVSGGCSEELVFCRVGSVGELVALRLLTHVKVSVRCLFKGRQIQSFSVVITCSTFFVFIFKSN